MFQEFHVSEPLIKRALRRITVVGGPNDGKTGSIYTLPGRVFVLSYPLEKGYMSLPRKNFQKIPIKAFVWPEIDVEKPVNWTQTWQQVETMTKEVLTGKYGEFDWFVGDGAHKLYDIALATRCAGANMQGKDFMDGEGKDAMGRAYGQAHRVYQSYWSMVMNSPIHGVVMMLWDGLDRVDELDTSKKAPKAQFADLPGQMARRILGEATITLHCVVDGVGAGRRFEWETQATSQVKCAGVKLPRDLMAGLNFPPRIKQDFNGLVTLLDGKVEAWLKDDMDTRTAGPHTSQ